MAVAFGGEPGAVLRTASPLISACFTDRNIVAMPFGEVGTSTFAGRQGLA
jgi:hypothetical protein